MLYNWYVNSYSNDGIVQYLNKKYTLLFYLPLEVRCIYIPKAHAM